MNIKFTLKKSIKWLVRIILLLIFYQVMYSLFIHDWRVRKSRERVEESIVKNFYDNQDKFKELTYFASTLPLIDIELLENDEVKGNLSRLSKEGFSGDEYPLWIEKYDENSERVKNNFEINEDSTVTFTYSDTTITIKYWNWDFEGNLEDEELSAFYKYTKCTKKQLKKLIKLVKEVDCEAIRITDDEIDLRYNGFILYHFRYLIMKSNEEPPEDYKKLDTNTYCGLYDSGLFCGTIIFSK